MCACVNYFKIFALYLLFSLKFICCTLLTIYSILFLPRFFIIAPSHYLSSLCLTTVTSISSLQNSFLLIFIVSYITSLRLDVTFTVNFYVPLFFYLSLTCLSSSLSSSLSLPHPLPRTLSFSLSP